MLPKERFHAVLKGVRPDRFPMWFGGDPELVKNISTYLGTDGVDETMDALGIDFRTLRPEYVGPELETYEDGSWETFWGLRRSGKYYGQAITHPLQNAESRQEIEEFDWPSQENWTVEHLKKEAKRYENYVIISGSWSPFFHDATDLLGFETCLTKMIKKPDIVKAVLDRCFDFYFELSRRSFEEIGSEVDLFFVGNDFGGKSGLLFSPKLWRQFIREPLQKLVDMAHEHDAKFALHSCGDVAEIIPDLIDMGVDLLNPIQISAEHMVPSELIDSYGDKLVFFGGIDEKELLRYGTEAEVRRETRRIIDILGAHNRYVVAPSHDYLLPDLPPENVVAMYDEAKN